MIAPNTVSKTSGYPIKILHLEDSLLDHHLVCRALKKSTIVYEIERLDTQNAFQEYIRHTPCDLVLMDYHLPGFTAMDAWTDIQAIGRATPCIIVSGTIGEEAAVSAIHLGVGDYLHKDNLNALPRVIQRTLDLQAIKLAKALADQELYESERRITEFAQHLQSAIERERAAIAREIHDDIGGALASARLDLAWLERHSCDQGIERHIATATDMIQHAIEACQRIMTNTRPAILDQGLLPAVQWLVQGFEKRTGTKVVLDAVNDAPLDANVLLTAYRTVQEALTNITKYATGSTVRIDITDRGGVLTVEVADNGPGISAETLQKTSAFGIRGLQERAKIAGGWVDIISGDMRGTAIILSMPLAKNYPDLHVETR